VSLNAIEFPLEFSKKRNRSSTSRKRPHCPPSAVACKAPENIPQAEAVAKAMGAELPRLVRFATKAGCRWTARLAALARPSRTQLYLALGISGAIQHVSA